jgi:hypothetical protein
MSGFASYGFSLCLSFCQSSSVDVSGADGKRDPEMHVSTVFQAFNKVAVV